eukprot:Em0005g621a
MPLRVMANFGGFLCECGLEGYVSLLIMLCYFGDAFVMQYISPINLLKASLVYGHVVRGDRCYKDYGFRLSQAVDSAERFDSNWSKTKTTTAPTSPSLEVTLS